MPPAFGLKTNTFKGWVGWEIMVFAFKPLERHKTNFFWDMPRPLA
jgi:hypothetical protein